MGKNETKGYSIKHKEKKTIIITDCMRQIVTQTRVCCFGSIFVAIFGH